MLLSNGDSRETKSEKLLTVKPQAPTNVDEEEKGPSAEDIASVITQVTARDQGSYRPFQQFRDPQGLGKTNWRTRVKSIFCCFSPATPAAYIRSPEETVGNHRQTAPITPPRVYKEYVIASKLEEDKHKKTLVLDLDETLVHSSFKPIPNPDYILPVEIDGKMVDVYVLKRPWLDHFMLTLGPRFEIVVFTASLAKYADPLLDLLDKGRNVRHRLFREACVTYEGNYVKDLNCLGRELADTIIVDNSPHSYVFQPLNAVPIGTFIDNMEDQELLQCLKMLLCLEQVSDVRDYISKNVVNQYSNQILLQTNGYHKVPASS